jgi:hypothetical protein
MTYALSTRLVLLLLKDQQVVQAFLPHAPQEPLTDRIGSGSLIGGFENLDTCAGYFRHPFRKNGICAKNSTKEQPSHAGSLSHLPERRGSDLFRTILLCCFFGEKSQAMKRLSLRSMKCLPSRDRDALLVVVICDIREKGTEGLRLPAGSALHHREPLAHTSLRAQALLR